MARARGSSSWKKRAWLNFPPAPIGSLVAFVFWIPKILNPFCLKEKKTVIFSLPWLNFSPRTAGLLHARQEQMGRRGAVLVNQRLDGSHGLTVMVGLMVLPSSKRIM